MNEEKRDDLCSNMLLRYIDDEAGRKLPEFQLVQLIGDRGHEAPVTNKAPSLPCKVLCATRATAAVRRKQLELSSP